MATRKPPRKYWECIVWIAANDDTEWLKETEPHASVTLTMVADIFNVPLALATEHLSKAVCINYRQRDTNGMGV